MEREHISEEKSLGILLHAFATHSLELLSMTNAEEPNYFTVPLSSTPFRVCSQPKIPNLFAPKLTITEEYTSQLLA